MCLSTCCAKVSTVPTLHGPHSLHSHSSRRHIFHREGHHTEARNRYITCSRSHSKKQTCVGSQAAWLQSLSSSPPALGKVRGSFSARKLSPRPRTRAWEPIKPPALGPGGWGQCLSTPKPQTCATLLLKQVSQEVQNPNEV